jgi:flagellar P-ring protein FlgI
LKSPVFPRLPSSPAAPPPLGGVAGPARRKPRSFFALSTCLLALCLLAHAARPAGVTIADIARLGGEMPNTLTGLGLVYGLKGTGDGGQYLAAMQQLAAVLKNMGNYVEVPQLTNASNVAIVMLTVDLPATGVRAGDVLNVKVGSAGAASSLKGGHLFITPLAGPAPNSPIPESGWGYATGDIDLEDAATPTHGVIKNGANITFDLVVSVMDPDGRMQLILDENSAHRITASTIAKIINDAEGNGMRIAMAIDGRSVSIIVPENERGRSNDFVSRILQLPVRMLPTEARVVVNKKTRTIVITGDVEISPVVISHQGLTITTVAPPPRPTLANPVITETRAVSIDTMRQGGSKLQDLLNALDTIKVPTEDRISILEALAKSGYLHAKLIEE